jgi:hypothetical protein
MIFSACTFYDVNKRKYNELSREHNTLANEALIKKNEAVDNYNVNKYEGAKIAAAEAKDLFTQAKEISQENQKNAMKIKDVNWLPDYQKKVVESESYWIEIMDLVIEACDAQISHNMAKANQLVKTLQSKVPQYEALQKEIDQIEEDHKDFFER